MANPPASSSSSYSSADSCFSLVVSSVCSRRLSLFSSEFSSLQGRWEEIQQINQIIKKINRKENWGENNQSMRGLEEIPLGSPDFPQPSASTAPSEPPALRLLESQWKILDSGSAIFSAAPRRILLELMIFNGGSDRLKSIELRASGTAGLLIAQAPEIEAIEAGETVKILLELASYGDIPSEFPVFLSFIHFSSEFSLGQFFFPSAAVVASGPAEFPKGKFFPCTEFAMILSSSDDVLPEFLEPAIRALVVGNSSPALVEASLTRNSKAAWRLKIKSPSSNALENAIIRLSDAFARLPLTVGRASPTGPSAGALLGELRKFLRAAIEEVENEQKETPALEKRQKTDEIARSLGFLV